MNRKTLFALLTSLALILALVGPVAAQDDPGTIVDIAAGNEDFSTLVAALQAAGLADTLNSEGPFTVFAPTNAAFEALPEGTVEALLADPAGDLTQILLYHVVPGRVMAADLSDGLTATTVNGADVTFTIADDTAMVNDANIVTTDIEASNGVIHVIDAVILPPSDDMAAEEGEDMAGDTAEGDMAEGEGDMADEEMAEDSMAEGDMADEEMAEEDMADAEATDEGMAAEDAEDMSQGGEGEMMDDSSKGAPSTMPTTGGNFGSSTWFILVAGAVIAGLAGTTWWSRRR